MKLLVAKRNGMSDDELKALAELGFELILDAVDYKKYEGDKSEIEAVICYQFFNHNDMADFPRLRAVHLTSAGYDHMPLEYMREKGIALFNNRGAYSAPIAEYVLWGVLDIYRGAEFYRKLREKREWRQKSGFRELSGKAVTILGAGSIASEISKRFTAMGCTVTALCRHPKPDPDFFAVHHASELDALLPGTDILILAAPLNESSHHIMDSSRFALMKPDSVFVNIARGGLCHTGALVEAIEKGILSGAVIDVTEEEPPAEDNPLWELDKVIFTPHNSFSGEFNGRRTFENIHRDFKEWLEK